MKKIKANLTFYFLSALFAIILLSNAVMADVPSDIAEGTKDFIEGIKDFGKPVFEALLGTSATGNEFVVQILAFILVTLIVYGILDSVNIFGGKSGINFAVGVIVSLIGIRFLPPGILEAMAIPSSALVATIVLVVPFIIAFYIIVVKMKEYPLARKLLWVVFAVIIIFLWFYNWDNTRLDGFRWIYPLIILASLMVLWFDGTLQKWLRGAETDTSIEKSSYVERDRIVAKIKDLQTALAGAESNEERTRLNNELRQLNENLKNI